MVVGERISVDGLRDILRVGLEAEEGGVGRGSEPVFVADVVADDEVMGEVGGAGGGKEEIVVGCIQPSRGIHGSSASGAHEGEGEKEEKQPPHMEVRSVEVRTPNGGLMEERKEVTVVPAMPEVLQPTPSPIPTPSLHPTSTSATATTSTSTPPVPKTGSAMIGLFGVSPAYQSHGIGKLLINHSISHIRDVWNCARIVLWVLDNRPELLLWYEKIGFVWNGETRSFVNPENLVAPGEFRILVKEL